ncbi:MAG TPA: glycosyltransferase family 4 protein [Mycobacteriales bacterium]
MSATARGPRTLRILHVTDSYLPTVGGIELHVADLAARQALQGHHVEVLTRAGVRSRGTGLLYAGATHDPAERRGEVVPLAAVLSSRAGYDVLHVHASVYSPLAWRATLASARQDVPVVFTAHSLLVGVRGPYRMAAEVLRLPRRPVIWSAVSRAAAATLHAGIGVDVRRIRILPNAVDRRSWQTGVVRDEPDIVTFVAVMRLAARKRPGALLRAFLRADVSGVARLCIVGDGPRGEACRRWCQAHPGADVTLVGEVDRVRVRSILDTADVFVAPATRESFGIAALEARESGLPVIARRGTGVADFVQDGEHGLLVGDDTAMADAIRVLAADRPLLRKLSARAHAEPSGFDWANAMASAEAAYRDASVLSAVASRATRR